MREVTTTLLLLIGSSLAAGSCPIEKIHGIGHCSYRIQCVNTIGNIKLDNECYGSSNYDVNIDITIQNASDAFHTETNSELLDMITTLTVYGNWPTTELSFLDSMYKLRNLYIVNNNIQEIINNPFSSLISIEHIDLSHNKLTEIDQLFEFEIRPYNLRKISLAYNTIAEISGDTFVELTSLIELDLSHNVIEVLNDKPFRNLTNLQILKLNNNKIKDLNGAMNNLLNLKHLYLRFNQIQNVDVESINTINHLETFDISKNQIENINSMMFLRHWKHFSNFTICKIYLSENLVNYLPNATVLIFERFRRNSLQNMVFTKLDLHNNSISHIEYNAFSYLELVSLDLSNNKLTDFIVNADDLINVKYLNLSGNFLNRLYYQSFSSMHNLQNLDLSHNYMDYFPDQSLSNTYNLKYVNITFNDILELHNLRITFHPGGGFLDLSNNGLSALIIPKNEAIGLRELVLNSNNISDAYLIRLIDQHNLIRLDMSNNFIQELDELSLQLPNSLGYLDLSYNEINRIKPSAFHRVSNLKTLKLAHNRLRTIEYGIFQGVLFLSNLELSFNHIDLLDSKVFMDLKFLRLLSLRFNGLIILNHESWFYHKENLTVYLDGNSLSCEWLAKALSDFNNGYSKMYPTVLESTVVGNSVEGIPCKQEVQNLVDPSSKYTDERLLITSQKILEAVQEQTMFLRKYMWHSILYEAERKTAGNRV